MDFRPTERQELLRQSLRDLLRKECPRELVREMDASDRRPDELLAKLSELGFAALRVPEEYGGQGGDVIDTMIVYEELSRVMPALAWALGSITLYGSEVMAQNGSAAQKAAYFPRLARGEVRFSFALTEPDAGSDAASLRTRAVWCDGAWVVNGRKIFITGADATDVVVTIARTAEGRDGLTAFLVDTRSPGYSARPLAKLGYHGSSACEVLLDDVRVAPDDVLGGPSGLNQGWVQMTRLLNAERLALAACALGIGEAALEDALAYAKERIQFNRPIGTFQAVQHRLVDMATELTAARQLASYAAWKETEGMECLMETSMAKYFVTETVKKVALAGMQVLGGFGYMMEADMQRYVRDALALTIGGGTSEIQKNIVGKKLGL